MAKRAEQQAKIGATPQECFDAVTDYDSFPTWQRAVTGVEVLDRDGQGRGKRVRFEVDLKVRKVGYTLDYSYEQPSLVSWRYVEGDVKDVQGDFTFEDQGDGTTLATYSLVIDPGMFMPGPLARLLSEGAMKGSVEDLRRRVETS